ncbi:MAG: InlB B-repeat-containing protein [Treponema sp.]|jgi:uncharacterized repeat protein (TIGR02543 family)|nr:InlB B-repeat-containing protein [Treponema sp.]
MKKRLCAIWAVLAVFAIIGCDSNPTTPPPTTPPEDFYTITFDKNTTDEGSTEARPTTRIVEPPDTTIVGLPSTPPTRPGYLFDSWNTKANGAGETFTINTEVTKSFTVYAQWISGAIVTFDKNNFDYDSTYPVPSTKKILSPATTIDALPTAPERDGYQFLEWNTSADGSGDAFDETTTVMVSLTVYAQWKFLGGTPQKVDNTIEHKWPSFKTSGSCAMNDDGTYKLTGGGNMDYLFPTDVDGEDARDYDYFIILTSIQSGESGNVTGIQLRRYETTTGYPGGGSNKMPWLSNPDGRKIILEVNGAETTGGFRIFVPDNVTVEKLKIESITFHKAPRYTVSFDYNYPGAPAIPDVTNVWGKDENHDGAGVGSAAWPADPDRTGEIPPMYFIGWIDAEGNTVMPGTSITGDCIFKADWIDAVPPGWIELIEKNAGGVVNPVYGFEIPAGESLADYRYITAKIKVPVNISGRFRAFGPFNAGSWTTWPCTNANAFQGSNAAGADILTTGGPAAGGSYNAANSWVEFTIDMNDRGGTHTCWDNNNKVGVVLIALGIIGNAGENPAISYFIKDIVIKSDDGSKVVEALNPGDNLLWGGQGETVFFKAPGSSSTVSRTIMFYQEG